MKLSARIIRFALVGGSGVVVNQSLFLLLDSTNLFSLWICSAIAIEVSIITNFICNALWTWRDQKAESFSHFFIQLFRFNLSSGATAFLLNNLPMIYLVEVSHWPKAVANLTGIGLASGVNFFVSHYWIFGKRKKSGK